MPAKPASVFLVLSVELGGEVFQPERIEDYDAVAKAGCAHVLSVN
jgi:hypothetical protein